MRFRAVKGATPTRKICGTSRGGEPGFTENIDTILATPRIKDPGESAIVGNLHATNTRIDRSIAQDGCQRGAKDRRAGKLAGGFRPCAHDVGGLVGDRVARAIDKEGSQEECAAVGVDIEATAGARLAVEQTLQTFEIERGKIAGEDGFGSRMERWCSTTLIGGTPSRPLRPS